MDACVCVRVWPSARNVRDVCQCTDRRSEPYEFWIMRCNRLSGAHWPTSFLVYSLTGLPLTGANRVDEPNQIEMMTPTMPPCRMCGACRANAEQESIQFLSFYCFSVSNENWIRFVRQIIAGRSMHCRMCNVARDNGFNRQWVAAAAKVIAHFLKWKYLRWCPARCYMHAVRPPSPCAQCLTRRSKVVGKLLHENRWHFVLLLNAGNAFSCSVHCFTSDAPWRWSKLCKSDFSHTHTHPHTSTLPHDAHFIDALSIFTTLAEKPSN